MSSLQPGVNVITVTATDGSGNAAKDVVRVSYERGLPTISITSPTTAATYTTSSSNVALTGVASDDSGIARVAWSTDTGQVGTAIGTTAWSIPAITVSLGTTVVTVTAYDNSGNASSVTLSIVYADTSKPAVKVYMPTTAASMTTSAALLTLAGTATDNVGVTQVTWATDRGASGTAFGGASWSTPELTADHRDHGRHHHGPRRGREQWRGDLHGDVHGEGVFAAQGQPVCTCDDSVVERDQLGLRGRNHELDRIPIRQRDDLADRDASSEPGRRAVLVRGAGAELDVDAVHEE